VVEMSKSKFTLKEFDVSNTNTTSTTSFYFADPEIRESVTVSNMESATIPGNYVIPTAPSNFVGDQVINFGGTPKFETIFVVERNFEYVPVDYSTSTVTVVPTGSGGIPISTNQLPPSYARIPQEVISIVLEGYREELRDPSSKESQFFSEVNKLKNTDEEKFLFTLVYTKLFRKEFKLKDFLEYIDNYELQITYDTIVYYIKDLDVFRINSLRQKIFNGQYSNFGNPYTFFIINILNNKDNLLIYNNVVEDDNIIKDENRYLLTPLVDYYKKDYYSNLRVAEEDYWLIVKDFYTSLGFTLNQAKTKFSNYTSQFTLGYTKGILDTLLNKNNNSKVYGIPILMNKRASKSEYSFFTYENQEIKRLLKESYKRITKDEFYNILDKFIVEILDYNIITEQDINYIDLSSLPDIETYTKLKLNYFNLASTKEKFTIDMLKEIKFYRYFLVPFFRITGYSDLFSFVDQKELELDNLRTLILNLREELKTKGKFI